MLRLTSVILLSLAASGFSQTHCYLKTIAGPSTFYGGDGGPAVNAHFNDISGFRWDSSGNLFIADSGNHRVREVTPDGLIKTIAGTGVAGFSGDGGPATQAELNLPVAVTPDNQGNVFFVDQANNRIRKIDSSGMISTVAGNGTANFGGDGGPATSAELQNPDDVVVDASGNLYISDTGNYRVRKVTPQGIISTWAGSGQHPYAPPDMEGVAATTEPLVIPLGLAIDTKGNLYVADRDLNRVFVVNPEGIIFTYAGNGMSGDAQAGALATATPVQNPYALAIDELGNLAITTASAIVEVAPSGALSIAASYPYSAIGFDQNQLYVFYRGSIDAASGNATGPLAGAPEIGNSGDGGPGNQALLEYPLSIAVDAKSNIYIADQGAYEIRKVAPDGTISHVAGTGQVGSSGDGGPAASAAIGFITAIALDPTGNFYMIGAGGNVRKIDTSGIISTVVAELRNLSFPSGLKVDSEGNLYVQMGSLLYMYKPPFSPSKFPVQYGGDIAFFTLDTAGVLYVVDTYGPTQLIRYAPSGQQTVLALPELPSQLVGGMAIDANGNFYIAWNGLLQEITPDGRVATIARQSNTLPYLDGAASQVALGPLTLTDLATDPSGNLYLAEPYNPTVRELTAGCPVPLQPLISSSGVVNAGSYQGYSVAPGEIVTIFGQKLGPVEGTSVPVSNGLFPLSYQGVQVTVNGYPAPLLYVSTGQVNAVVPFEIGDTSAILQLTYNGVTSDPYYTSTSATSPGIFVIANSDGVANTAGTPAKAGDYITIYGTGQGVSAMPETDGQILGATLFLPLQPVEVSIDTSIQAPVLYAGSAPSLVAGVLQINVVVPSGLNPGSHSIAIGTQPGELVTSATFYTQ